MRYWGMIGGALGWILSGPLGALVGICIGGIIDGAADEVRQKDKDADGYTDEEQRNSFMFSMLVLAARVMQADGKVVRSELEYAYNFFKLNFGADSAKRAIDILLKLFRQSYDTAECSKQVASFTTHEQRLQLFSFLVGIARADGGVSTAECDALRNIAFALGLTVCELDSILNLSGDTIESAYKVLELNNSATNDEVRHAYRRLAIKHHPDSVANLGPDIQKAAEKKFRQISEAYKRICRDRGM